MMSNDAKVLTLEEMAALEAKATPGPWRGGTHETHNVFAATQESEDRMGPEWVVAQSNRNFQSHVGDARFIAAARAFVPWAIARIRELEARVAELTRGPTRLEQLERELAVAGDRRDADDVTRLEAEIEAELERTREPWRLDAEEQSGRAKVREP